MTAGSIEQLTALVISLDPAVKPRDDNCPSSQWRATLIPPCILSAS
ncbi:MAG TPA: hypothetical protein LFV92_01125 [Rickettsia endosymbiont of Ceroptres masudai]|nr:hypothetical protein [Rickettsia endosymbiont of Ceroptres masudai]